MPEFSELFFTPENTPPKPKTQNWTKAQFFLGHLVDGWVITAFHALMSLSNSTLSCRFEDRFMRSSEWEAVVTCPVVTHQYPSKIVLETISIFRLDMMM